MYEISVLFKQGGNAVFPARSLPDLDEADGPDDYLCRFRRWLREECNLANTGIITLDYFDVACMLWRMVPDDEPLRPVQ